MFRSLMTITMDLYLYVAKVIFMLKHSLKLRRYMYRVIQNDCRGFNKLPYKIHLR